MTSCFVVIDSKGNERKYKTIEQARGSRVAGDNGIYELCYTEKEIRTEGGGLYGYYNRRPILRLVEK